MSISHNRVVKYSSLVILNIIRGMPLLMVIFWMYFLLPAFLGRTVLGKLDGNYALTLFTSAYCHRLSRKVSKEIYPQGTDRGRAINWPSHVAGHGLYRLAPGVAQYDSVIC
jgi:polar amino acid transport system permease protein